MQSKNLSTIRLQIRLHFARRTSPTSSPARSGGIQVLDEWTHSRKGVKKPTQRQKKISVFDGPPHHSLYRRAAFVLLVSPSVHDPKLASGRASATQRDRASLRKLPSGWAKTAMHATGQGRREPPPSSFQEKCMEKMQYDVLRCKSSPSSVQRYLQKKNTSPALRRKVSGALVLPKSS